MKRLALGLLLIAACGNGKPATKGNAEAATTSVPPLASSAAQIESDASVEAAAPPEVLAGADFATDAKTLFRVAACGNTDTPVPEGFDATVIDAHCKEMQAMFVDYKKTWMDIAM